MMTTLSVLGLYNFNNTIFDSMVLPAEMTATDKEVLVDNLLMECAELEVIYTNPVFIKSAIAKWSYKELPTWEKIYAAATSEYNPIENYNRHEEVSEITDGTRKHSGNDTRRVITDDASVQNAVTNNSSTNSGSDSVTNSGTDNTTNNIAAFDTNTLVTHDTSALQHGHVETTQHGHVVTDAGSGTTRIDYDGDTSDTFTHGEQIKDDMEVSREAHLYGNIGVTTSQQMLEQELEVAPKLNVINYIIDSFKKRFCVLVY